MAESAEITETTTTDTPEREVLGWLEFGEASRGLATSVLESGFVPGFLIALGRGGLLRAGALAYATGTKSCGSLNVEFYSDIETTLPEPVILPPMLKNTALFGRNTLL